MTLSRMDAAVELVAKFEAFDIAEESGIEAGIEQALKSGIQIGHDRTFLPTSWKSYEEGYKKGIRSGVSFIEEIVTNLMLSGLFNNEQIEKFTGVLIDFVRCVRRRLLEKIIEDPAAFFTITGIQPDSIHTETK